MMNRKELLLRQNRGRQVIDGYCKTLQQVLKSKVDVASFLTLPKTDEIAHLFFDTHKTAQKVFSKIYNADDDDVLESDVKKITLLRGKNAYLVNKLSELCGAAKVNADEAIENYKALIELDGDSLCLVSEDHKNFFYIDHYEENGRWLYELSAW
jgi:hypothetical protein